MCNGNGNTCVHVHLVCTANNNFISLVVPENVIRKNICDIVIFIRINNERRYRFEIKLHMNT